MKRELVIIGGGGHTRVLIGMANAMGLAVRGIVTSSSELLGKTILDVPVLGLEEDADLDPKAVTLLNGVGNHARATGPCLAPRAALYQRYVARGFLFAPFISPHAMVQPYATLAAGVQVIAGAVIQANASIGENVIINTSASIDHDAVIGAHCHIAPGALLCGQVVIGEETHIGAGAVIIDKIRIGARAMIGAGAVVTRDVPDGGIVFPARSTHA